MNLKYVSETVLTTLIDYEVKDLPNQPNLNGVIEQSDITFAIISGQRNNDNATIKVVINVSISATFRIKNDRDDQQHLYGLMRGVINKLHNRKVPNNGGLIKLLNFENYAPESGKWRSLLTFEVDIYIENEKDDNCLYLELI